MAEKKKGDQGLMIVAAGIILVGIIGLFLDRMIGGFTLFVGAGLFLMGFLSKSPGKKS